jgi:arsenic resistance protein ArsH
METEMNDHLPNIQPELIDLPSLERLEPKDPST